MPMSILQAPEMGQVELTRAASDKMLEIRSVGGGYAWENRFDSLGIRKGRKVRKIACQPFGGPVAIEIDGAKISLGRGIASKIEVEVVVQSTSGS
jgi:ferrous iron transport protein A